MTDDRHSELLHNVAADAGPGVNALMPTSVEAALTWIGVFLVLACEGYLLDRDERLSVNPTMSYRHGPLISEDESDLFSGVVVGIGPRRKRDLDTRVRVRLDANGKQISVPAPAISLGKS